MSAGRLPVVAAVAAVLALPAGGCAEWPVSNPYDPRSGLVLRIVGPDTLRNYGETATYRLETEPAWRSDWPPLVVEWTGTGADGEAIARSWLQASGGATAVVTLRRSDGLTAVPLRARVGEATVFKTTFVRVTPTALRAQACGGAAGAPLVLADGASRSICHRLVDRDGEDVAWPPESPIVRVSSRDASVAEAGIAATGRGEVRARADGATWVDVSLTAQDGRSWRDSVAVVVRLAR
jgi:hypothetical protein